MPVLCEPSPVVESATPEKDEDDIEPYFPARLINLFLKETESRLSELRESLQRGDMGVIMRITHTIKGTAGNFRAHRLYEITREIEKYARENQADAIRPLVAQAEETFKIVKARYQHSSSIQPVEIKA